MLKKYLPYIIGGLASLLGFLLTYFNQPIVFLIVFLVLPLMFLFQPVKDPDAASEARKQANQRNNRIATIAGFLYVAGAILSFIVKYYIVGAA